MARDAGQVSERRCLQREHRGERIVSYRAVIREGARGRVIPCNGQRDPDAVTVQLDRVTRHGRGRPLRMRPRIRHSAPFCRSMAVVELRTQRREE